MSLLESDHMPRLLLPTMPENHIDLPPQPSLHFYEVWESETGALKMRDGVLPYGEVREWLNLKGNYHLGLEKEPKADQEMILRLIACDYHRHPFAIGCGDDTFRLVKDAFGLHENSEETILNNNGAFSRYYTCRSDPAKADTFSLIFKVANGLHIGYDALSMTYDITRKTTRAFIHGFLDNETQSLFKHLQTLKEKCQFEQPLLLPTHIYQGYRAKTEAYRVLVDDSLCTTEVETGYAVPGMLLVETRLRFPPSRRYRPGQYSSRPKILDFEGITRQLHSVSTELGTVVHAGTFGKELGTFLCRTGQELERSQLFSPGEKALFDNRALVQNIEFCTNMYTSLISQASALKERVRNHINLVNVMDDGNVSLLTRKQTFSLIAQDENRIARSVAEQSTMVAMATKRDSSAMKSISLLTMVFLPPTFVATFFSMTMFNWTPDPETSSIASKYIWVYWVVAVPLTVTVVLTWHFWVNKENKKHEAYKPALDTEPGEIELKDAGRGKRSELRTFKPVRELMGEYSEARRDQLRPPRRTQFSVYGIEDSSV